MARYLDMLRRNPGYTRLWLAQVVSLTGDWFNTIVLSALVARYSDGSGLAVSLFLMARFLPPLLIGPFAGVLVDRFDRKRILIYCNLLRVFVVLGFLFATTPDTLWLIYTLTLAQFTLSAFFEPAQGAITPRLVRREDLVIANTLSSITWSSMLALGAILGGVVAALFGPVVALVIDAATFAVAAWFIAGIRVDAHPDAAVLVDATPQDEEAGSFLDGIRYLWRNKMTAAVLMVKGGGSIGNVDLLMTIYATQIFVLGIDGQLSLGILYSAFGLGAMSGPLIMNRVNDGSVPRMRRLILIGFMLAVVGWVLLGAAGGLMLAAFGLAVRAMGSSANWTYSSVIIQKSVPDRYLGRVFSLDLAIFQLVTVVSTVIHGLAIDMMRGQAADRQFLLAYGEAFLHEAALFTGDFAVVGVPAIVYVTGLASIFPVLVWWLLLPRMRRDTSLEASTAPVAGD